MSLRDEKMAELRLLTDDETKERWNALRKRYEDAEREGAPSDQVMAQITLETSDLIEADKHRFKEAMFILVKLNPWLKANAVAVRDTDASRESWARVKRMAAGEPT